MSVDQAVFQTIRGAEDTESKDACRLERSYRKRLIETTDKFMAVLVLVNIFPEVFHVSMRFSSFLEIHKQFDSKHQQGCRGF